MVYIYTGYSDRTSYGIYTGYSDRTSYGIYTGYSDRTSYGIYIQVTVIGLAMVYIYRLQ